MGIRKKQDINGKEITMKKKKKTIRKKRVRGKNGASERKEKDQRKRKKKGNKIKIVMEKKKEGR